MPVATRKSPKSVAQKSTNGLISYAEFLRWDGENQHVEWIDGRMVAMAAVTHEHALLNQFLLGTIPAFVEHHDLGEILSDPFQMKTGPDLPGRAPDILFVAKANLHRVKRVFVDGPADLVIEVISQGSKATDRIHKYGEYERGGVREYWLLDPLKKQADFFLRNRRATFESVKVEGGIYRSAVIDDLWIKVDWLWKRPKVLTVLKQWKLV